MSVNKIEPKPDMNFVALKLELEAELEAKFKKHEKLLENHSKELNEVKTKLVSNI